MLTVVFFLYVLLNLGKVATNTDLEVSKQLSIMKSVFHVFTFVEGFLEPVGLMFFAETEFGSQLSDYTRLVDLFRILIFLTLSRYYALNFLFHPGFWLALIQFNISAFIFGDISARKRL